MGDNTVSDYYIFDTQGEWASAEATLHADNLGYHLANDPEGYTVYSSNTTRWASEKTRATDGKYILPVCDHCDHPEWEKEVKQENWD